MGYVTMKQLLEAGVHFGHQTRRWNPKMKPYIFGSRNGIYIIDLQQTVKLFATAYDAIKNITAKGGNVLFVGTKKQAQDAIKEHSTACGMDYVNHRWIGGLLTNFATIKDGIKRLRALNKMHEAEYAEATTKKEALMLERERLRLEKNIGGIINMEKIPQAIFVIDSRKEHIAIQEAKRLGMAVIAIVDTNCDPEDVDYIIPGNDDAIKAIKLFASTMSAACMAGKAIYEESLTASTDKEEQVEAKSEGLVVEAKKEAKPAVKPEVKAEPKAEATETAAAPTTTDGK